MASIRLRYAVVLVAAASLSGCAAFGYPAGGSPSGVAGIGAERSGTAPGESYIVNGQRYRVLPSARGYRETGIASWYGPGFDGKRTSSGEVFDRNAMTAAHRSLPFGTPVEVRELRSGRVVVVRINDRGPFEDPERRIIDLSHAAAEELGIVGPGTAEVEVRALPAGETPSAFEG